MCPRIFEEKGGGSFLFCFWGKGGREPLVLGNDSFCGYEHERERDYPGELARDDLSTG